MHEIDMTRALLTSLQEWKLSYAPRDPHVNTVHLEIGAFTCVEPDQLVFTWDAAISDSWLQGARLAIDPVPLMGRCVRCQNPYEPKPDQGYRSPCCSHPMEEIISGRELRIRSIDYTFA